MPLCWTSTSFPVTNSVLAFDCPVVSLLLSGYSVCVLFGVDLACKNALAIVQRINVPSHVWRRNTHAFIQTVLEVIKRKQQITHWFSEYNGSNNTVGGSSLSNQEKTF